jgi:hypothetical protein
MNERISMAVMVLLLFGVLALPTPPAEAQRPDNTCVGGALVQKQKGEDLQIENKTCTVSGKVALDFGRVVIGAGGTLLFPEGQNSQIDFKVNDIIVESGGRLVAGDASPFGSNGGRLTITFRGAPTTPCEKIDDVTDFCGKGLVVKPGGSVKLSGAKGVAGSGVSWTHLRDAAGPTTGPYVAGARVAGTGPTTLKLAKDVTQGAGAWKPGDWIVVATTSFSPFESEFVKIASLTADGEGTTVTLESNTFLQYYHFGSKDPGVPSNENYHNGPRSTAEYNYGVDERAEVGLISRSIKLTAQVDDPKHHWGGEIKLMHGAKEIVLQGVEIEKFGKAKLGAYPVHLHVMGDLTAGGGTPPTLNGNSIHHSYNKCFTIHSTQNATIENNVCARIVGHIFYQEVGDEGNTTFRNNLGLGAMSHYFDVHGANRDDLIKAHWWKGDYLVKEAGYNYDGFNVPNTDAQDNPTRGWCYKADPGRTGGLVPMDRPPCNPAENTNRRNEVYFEPPSGFWIINPKTTLTGNSIGGCQGVGRAYWYVPPDPVNTDRDELKNLRWTPIGKFSENRAHGCYSGLYAESEFDVQSTQLFPRDPADEQGKSKLLTFDAFTATRNRDRGVWIRPVWVVLTNARFATNKHNVSLVTTGGIDGNAPGVWSLLANAVSVGVSENNVDRFGPCPNGNPTGLDRSFGCIDQTRIPGAGDPPPSGDQIGQGYPNFQVGHQLYGYLIYDGPARIFNNRFVNFKKDIKPLLTTQDRDALGGNDYEGDAALGWFNSNPSQYPNATASSGLVFENVDLRHQVFTERVNTGTFADGDKNTAILDLDGTLAGYVVVDTRTGKRADEAFAMSLNNLPFNTSGNAVAECLSVGLLDEKREAGRPTALMSPSSIGTLEFEALYPYPPESDKDYPAQTCISQHHQVIKFSKDAQDFGAHQSMSLFGRNGLGVWEPKVASGEGYTVAAEPGKSPAAGPPPWCQPVGTLAGIPSVINVGVSDIVKPHVSKDNPFWIRLGVCYTDKNGHFPAGDKITIKRGYKSYGGGFAQINDLGLQKFWNQLNQRYQGQSCLQLDGQAYADGEDLGGNKKSAKSTNLDPVTGCPADGVTPPNDKTTGEPTGDFGNATCPAGAELIQADQTGKPACIYHKTDLTRLTDDIGVKGLTQNGKPVLDKFYYDQKTGLLFLNVAQEYPNPIGPSPLGDCAANSGAPCPHLATGETYYACPPQGCLVYTIRINDAAYEPGPSRCQPYPTYAQERPAGDFALAYVGNGQEPFTTVTTKTDGTPEFPYYSPTTEPVCPVTTH